MIFNKLKYYLRLSMNRFSSKQRLELMTDKFYLAVLSSFPKELMLVQKTFSLSPSPKALNPLPFLKLLFFQMLLVNMYLTH